MEPSSLAHDFMWLPDVSPCFCSCSVWRRNMMAQCLRVTYLSSLFSEGKLQSATLFQRHGFALILWSPPSPCPQRARTFVITGDLSLNLLRFFMGRSKELSGQFIQLSSAYTEYWMPIPSTGVLQSILHI